MIETLLAYIDGIQQFGKDVSFKTFEYNGRYKIAEEMRKFVLEDLLPYFIETSAKELRGLPLNNNRVVEERNRFIKICETYPTYVVQREVIDYFDAIVQN